MRGAILAKYGNQYYSIEDQGIMEAGEILMKGSETNEISVSNQLKANEYGFALVVREQ